MSLRIPIVSQTLPEGACNSIATLQNLADILAANFVALMPTDMTGIIISTTAPTDQTKAWMKLDNYLRPAYTGLLRYCSGYWLGLHPLKPGMGIIWYDALPDFTTFDGGDANPVGIMAGPMWELVASTAAKIPIGAGTLPSGTVLAIGATGGEEKHSLTEAEIAPHTHNFPDATNAGTTGPVGQNLAVPDGGIDSATGPFTGVGITTSNRLVTQSAGGSGSPAVVTPHNTLPPYVVVSYLRRTIRQYYVET